MKRAVSGRPMSIRSIRAASAGLRHNVMTSVPNRILPNDSAILALPHSSLKLIAVLFNLPKLLKSFCHLQSLQTRDGYPIRAIDRNRLAKIGDRGGDIFLQKARFTPQAISLIGFWIELDGTRKFSERFVI